MAEQAGTAWLRWWIVRMSSVPGLATPPPASDQVEVLLQRLDPQLPAPGYAHPGDAGADLLTTVDVTLAPGERATVPTGMAIAC